MRYTNSKCEKIDENIFPTEKLRDLSFKLNVQKCILSLTTYQLSVFINSPPKQHRLPYIVVGQCNSRMELLKLPIDVFWLRHVSNSKSTSGLNPVFNNGASYKSATTRICQDMVALLKNPVVECSLSGCTPASSKAMSC